MTTFETIEKHEITFKDNGNKDNFIFAARKIAHQDEGLERRPFLQLTRGYFDAQNARRYKTNLTFPDEEDVAFFIAYALLQMFDEELGEMGEQMKTVLALGHDYSFEDHSLEDLP